MKELTFKKVITWLSFVAGGCILAYLLYVISEVLIIFILSILLAFIFQPFISILENKGLNRVTSIFSRIRLNSNDYLYGVFIFNTQPFSSNESVCGYASGYPSP